MTKTEAIFLYRERLFKDRRIKVEDAMTLTERDRRSVERYNKEIEDKFDCKIKCKEGYFCFEPNSPDFDYSVKKYSEGQVIKLLDALSIEPLFRNIKIETVLELIENNSIVNFELNRFESGDNANKELEIIFDAVKKRRKLSMIHKGKFVEAVEPQKIFTKNGIWYFLGKKENNLKIYRISCVDRPKILSESFEYDEAADKMLKSNDSIWMSSDDKMIVAKVRVDKEVREYFFKRNILPNQSYNDERTPDGDPIFVSEIGHHMALLPIVKQWIPHLEILEPQELREQLYQDLNTYIDKK
ncbi:MAG: WYL domain-containing protein [Spirochaetales bacterium]|nr:WYL domain-containing protein [Spirochaetales bacterium]